MGFLGPNFQIRYRSQVPGLGLGTSFWGHSSHHYERSGCSVPPTRGLQLGLGLGSRTGREAPQEELPPEGTAAQGLSQARVPSPPSGRKCRETDLIRSGDAGEPFACRAGGWVCSPCVL